MKLICNAVKKVKSINKKDEIDEYSIYKFETVKDEEVYADMSLKSINGMFDKGDELEIKRTTKQAKLKK